MLIMYNLRKTKSRDASMRSKSDSPMNVDDQSENEFQNFMGRSDIRALKRKRHLQLGRHPEEL